MPDVGCAGILVADTFCGPMTSLPAEGQLLAIDSMSSKAGGCGANVAICLARQGIEVDVAGCLGNDPSAKIVLSYFEDHDIGCRHLVYTDQHPTSKTVILLVDGQDRRYIHTFGANKAFTVGQIDRDWLKQLKVFYLGGLFVMPAVRTDELLELLEFCRLQGIVTVVDVVLPQDFAGHDDLRTLLPHIDYFLPNDDEARQITGKNEPLGQVRDLLAEGGRCVIITQGSKGAIAARGGQFWRSGTYPVKAIDPSGSGDAFAAGIIAGILRGRDMPDTLCYASALGASATRAVGTTDGVFTAEEAESFRADHSMEISAGSL